MSEDRELDVVVFGATGFVGRLVAGYLADYAPAGVRIGLAGRSQRRLAEARTGLGAAASAWPLLAADSADLVSLAALARAARVVVTTVGPYRAQGLALVEACAAAGTDYADLTGEVLFIRDSIGRCHDVAARAGARIVHCCGFDSVPSDIGVLMLHHAARADGAGDLLDTTLVVTALRGGISGGTLASLMGQQDEVLANAEHRRVVGDPYALSPDRAAEPDLGDERDQDWVRYDGDLRMWTGPFAMAGLNTRVVRRSNALQAWAYGRRFRYREVTGFGGSPAAPVLAVTVSAADPPCGFFPDADPHQVLGRGAVHGHGRGPGRPGICRHIGDARRSRAVPGAGPGAPSRPGRRPNAGHGNGHRARGPAQISGAHSSHPADRTVTRPRHPGSACPALLRALRLRRAAGLRSGKRADPAPHAGQASISATAAPGQRHEISGMRAEVHATSSVDDRTMRTTNAGIRHPTGCS